MSLVTPDTLRKKLLGNIATLEKKITEIDAKYAEKLKKEKQAHELQIKGYQAMIEMLDEQNPPLPLVPPIDKAGVVVEDPNQHKLSIEDDKKETAETDSAAAALEKTITGNTAEENLAESKRSKPGMFKKAAHK